MSVEISVIIPAHNPDAGRLRRTLEGLRAQTMPAERWETVLVDNGSQPPLVAAALAKSAPPNLRVVREDTLGLTPARLRGFAGTTGALVVLVDDDNVLAPDFLAHVASIAAENPRLGAWSGNVVLEFEPGAVPPPAEWRSYLTERRVDTDRISSDRDDHGATPWGAGLCIRREVCSAYAAELAGNPLRRQLDLQGSALLYGGDTDIAFVGCAKGFTMGVFSRLTLIHLIPARRCEPAYLFRSMEGHAYSAVMHGYILHGSIEPSFTDPVWLAKSWVRRLLLSRSARLESAAKARGAARAVRDIRRLNGNLPA